MRGALLHADYARLAAPVTFSAALLLNMCFCSSSLPVTQSLVIGSSMVVVAFVTLLQNPLLGSPSWLPLLAAGWAGAFIVTMVLQSTLPLPNIQR
jgi:hypothetical protein